MKKYFIPLGLALLTGCNPLISARNAAIKTFYEPPILASSLSKDQEVAIKGLFFAHITADTTSTKNNLEYLADNLEGELPIIYAFKGNLERKRQNYELAEEYLHYGLGLLPESPTEEFLDDGLFVQNRLTYFMLEDICGLVNKDKAEYEGEDTYEEAKRHFTNAFDLNTEYSKYAKKHLEELNLLK